MSTRIRLDPKIITALVGFVCFVVFLRFWQITQNQFLFYDEGMYLGYNRKFLSLVQANPPRDLNEFFIILGLMFKTALSTAKALWFFILNLRVFFVGAEAWSFARIVSACAGLATVILTYFWAKRVFKDQRVALLSAAFLSVLPSHVFYSRSGMQESLSTLLFLGAVYLYGVSRRVDWRLFFAVVLLSSVFFTNYRMIIAPFLFVFIEFYQALFLKQRVRWLKLCGLAAGFYALVFWVGSLYGGINRHVTFAWMFRQAGDATGKFDWLSVISYPYYVFALEGVFFGLLFWASIGAAVRKQWQKLLPFGIVCAQMVIFTLAAEKGARYLCVVLPFMAVAAGVMADEFLARSDKRARFVGMLLVGLALGSMGYQSIRLAFAKTEYQAAVEFVLSRSPQTTIVSTQPLVEELYVPSTVTVSECPKDLAGLVELYQNGARYLILDPQAYISWTASGERFAPTLIRFLEIIHRQAPTIAEFPHLNKVLLTRFVLDHNEHLLNSMLFISEPNADRSHIRVYDLGIVLAVLKDMSRQGSLWAED